jgi:hypothetical protein
VTFAPHSHPELSDPVPGDGLASTPARPFTEPLREMSAFALLAGNAVFLVIAVSRLFFVIERWAAEFGLRCADVFSTFVGPYSVGFPLAAVLLATHIAPMVPRTRLVLMVALIEYAVSGFFGVVTFLGAFAHDLSSPRAVIEGVLGRGVWLGFLILASMVLYRIWRGLFPPPRPAAPVFGGHGPTTYGRPYPGQPLYPQPTTPAGSPPGAGSPQPVAGWPEVPPPPMPAPLAVDADPTTRIIAAPQPPETGGDATQVVPLQPASPTVAADKPEPPTEQITGREP